MNRFPCAHATHPQWRMAAALVLAQLRAQMALPGHASAPGLGLLYITDHYAAEAQDILDHLGAELPEVTDWAGTVGVGIAASGVEYFDEPALTVMLCDLGPDQYRVFNGVAPLPQRQDAHGFVAHTALLHADADTPDVAELIAETAERTTSGYVFGGLASSRQGVVQFALGSQGNLRGQGAAGGVFHGGLSGVAFGPDVGWISRITQGAQPVGPAHRVTRSDANLVLELDGEPALDVLVRDLGLRLDQPQAAMPRLRRTLVGLGPDDAPEAGPVARRRTGHFGSDVRVRHLIGLDLGRQAFAVADTVAQGVELSFCERHVAAARADLVRLCTEVRGALEPETLPERHGVDAAAIATDETEPAPAGIPMLGAIYVSCAGRGGPHFGGPSAELQLVRHALGDVPLVGFFAGGEIAHHRLYGYTGVLTVFTAPA